MSIPVPRTTTTTTAAAVEFPFIDKEDAEERHFHIRSIRNTTSTEIILYQLGDVTQPLRQLTTKARTLRALERDIALKFGKQSYDVASLWFTDAEMQLQLIVSDEQVAQGLFLGAAIGVQFNCWAVEESRAGHYIDVLLQTVKQFKKDVKFLQTCHDRKLSYPALFQSTTNRVATDALDCSKASADVSEAIEKYNAAVKEAFNRAMQKNQEERQQQQEECREPDKKKLKV